MQCHQPYDLIGYAKELLAAPEMDSAREHLSACADCRREMVSLQRIFSLVRGVPEVEPTPAFVEQVMVALPAARPERVRREATVPAWTVLVRVLRARFSGAPMWAVSVVAHLLLFVALTVYFYRNATESDGPGDGSGGGSSLAAGNTGGKKTARSDAPRLWSLGDPDEKLDDPILGLVELRTAAGRQRAAVESGAGGVAPAAERGLAWLAARQRNDGGWDPATEGGKSGQDTGITGLAVLAFLANGHTGSAGEHRETLRRALDRLVQQQGHDGRLGAEAESGLLDHGIAASALLEAWLMTGEERLRQPAVAAVLYIVHAQSKAGGWGSAVRADSCDVAVSVWQMHALRLAHAAGLRGADVSLDRAAEWLATVTDAQGRVAGGVAPAATAIGMFCRVLGGAARPRDLDARQAALVLASRPGTGGYMGDLALRHFGTLALFQHGGEAWRAWIDSVRPELFAGQGADGSWGAPAGDDGARLAATATRVLTLSVPWRYPRVAGR